MYAALLALCLFILFAIAVLLMQWLDDDTNDR